MANTTQKPPMPTPDNRYDTTGKTMASTPGGTNVNMWNTTFMSGPAPMGGPDKNRWNTRFDYAPRDTARTYDGKKMTSIGPAPKNKVGF